MLEYKMEELKEKFQKYLNAYNQTWCDKDIDKLKEFYDTENNRLIYYDNHKDNDTYTLEEHITLVSEFLTKGKKTESGQVEVSGIAVDREKNMVWMTDWVDSRYVYCYSLETGQYYTKMQCQPTPYWAQGVFIADGKMLITADDGESMYNIPDNIYMIDIHAVPFTGLKEGTEVVKESPFSVKLDKDGKPEMRTGKIAGGAQHGRVELFREMNDFRRTGEIEGLSIDPTNDDLVVLNNRGTTIVLGMSQGPIKAEGYTKEVRELYIYEKVK